MLPVGRLGLNADQPGVMTGRLTRGGSTAAAGTATLSTVSAMSATLQSTTKAMIVVNDSGIYITNGKGASITLVGPTVTINNGALAVI